MRSNAVVIETVELQERSEFLGDLAATIAAANHRLNGDFALIVSWKRFQPSDL